MKKLTFYLITMTICASAQAELADAININGFGSVVAASVVDGEGYIAEYPNLGTYEDKTIDFGQETRIGLQITGNINEKMSITTQLLMRAANEFDVEVPWAYLSYQVTNTGALQLGRLRVPVYHFSEFMDVGYAYPWLRIPADTYSLDLINYEGLRFVQQFAAGSYPIELTFVYGNQDNKDDKLMSYLFPSRIDREFEDIAGVAINFDMDFVVLRSSYVRADMFETRHLSAFVAGVILGIPNNALYPSSTGMVDSAGDLLVAFDTEYDISFFDASIKATMGNFNLFAEYNKYKPFYQSYFGSFGYTWGEIEGYISYSKFDLDLPWESHDTWSLGFRYDFMPNVALKFDISRFDDTGFNPFTGEPNPVYQGARVINGGDGNGDATIVSAGFDFVF